MELNNKEKKVKQVLSEVHFDVDTDFLWKEVSKELDKKKKRRILWFLPFGMAITLGLVYLFSNYNLSPKHFENDNLSNVNHSTQNIAKNNNHTTFQTTTQTNSPSNSLEEGTVEAVLNENAPENFIKNQTTTQSKTKAIKHSAKTNAINFSIINSAKPSNIELQKMLRKQNTSAQTLSSQNQINKPSNTTYAFDKLKLQNIDKLFLNTLTFQRTAPSITLDHLAEIDIANEYQRRYYLGIGIGTIQNINTSHKIENDFSNEYFGREVELPGINSSLQVGFYINNNLRIFGGVDYAQLITRYKNQDVEKLVEPIQIDQPFINALNVYENSIGSINEETTVKNDLTWHQRHNMVDLQLGISKNILKSGRLSIAPEFSLLQNIYSTHSGYYFNETAPHFTKFENNDENPYRKNTGLKTQLGLQIAYQAGGFDMSINTAWRNPISNITEATNFYQIKNSQLSIQARVNYLLNWENK